MPSRDEVLRKAKEDLERIRAEIRLLQKRREDPVGFSPLDSMRLSSLVKAEKELIQKMKQ